MALTNCGNLQYWEHILYWHPSMFLDTFFIPEDVDDDEASNFSVWSDIRPTLWQLPDLQAPTTTPSPQSTMAPTHLGFSTPPFSELLKTMLLSVNPPDIGISHDDNQICLHPHPTSITTCSFNKSLDSPRFLHIPIFEIAESGGAVHLSPWVRYPAWCTTNSFSILPHQHQPAANSQVLCVTLFSSIPPFWGSLKTILLSIWAYSATILPNVKQYISANPPHQHQPAATSRWLPVTSSSVYSHFWGCWGWWCQPFVPWCHCLAQLEEVWPKQTAVHGHQPSIVRIECVTVQCWGFRRWPFRIFGGFLSLSQSNEHGRHGTFCSFMVLSLSYFA